MELADTFSAFGRPGFLGRSHGLLLLFESVDRTSVRPPAGRELEGTPTSVAGFVGSGDPSPAARLQRRIEANRSFF